MSGGESIWAKVEELELMVFCRMDCEYWSYTIFSVRLKQSYVIGVVRLGLCPISTDHVLGHWSPGLWYSGVIINVEM